MMNLLKESIYDYMKLIDKKKAQVDFYTDIVNATKLVEKDLHLSQKARVEGDKLFAQDNTEIEHQHKIIRLYNESIGYAPIDSEDLAKTYANKSALLRRMRRYAECISEADNALKITKSTSMKIKLLCRKADCHTALGSAENRGCLEKARFFLTKFEVTDESKKMKKMLEKLIKTTQDIIDDDKLNAPKQAKRISQTSKLVAKAQETDVRNNSVKVDYSETYGLHLVAARDIEPGEIVILEKPYHSHIQYAGIYQYCYHCMQYLWTTVPCDHCDWRLYCSEKCKNDSWDQYHDMECFVLSCVRKRMGFKGCKGYFIISIFLKTLKEAGSIEQLLADVELIDQKKGQFINEFSPDGGFTYKSIYASPINANLTKIELQDHADTAVGMLVGLSVFTKIFDERHDPRSMKTLMKDQTAISVGALLMQLDIMMGKGPNSFKLIDPTDLDAGYRDHNAIPEYERCQIEGSSLHSLTLMGLFGCIPNIKTGFTRDRLFITHSLQPIKKGDKLIIFNISSSVFNYIPTTTRQFFHQKIYNCPCNCQACTENWCVDDLRRRGVERVVYNQLVFFEMVNELNLLIEAKKANSRSYINPDKKAVAKVTDLLVRAWKHCEMPSTVITRAVRTFVETVGYFHGESRYDWI